MHAARIAPAATGDADGVKFCDAEFDRRVERARATADAATRHALCVQAQRIFRRERPCSPIAHSTLHLPLRREVHGLVMAPSGKVDFEDVYR